MRPREGASGPEVIRIPSGPLVDGLEDLEDTDQGTGARAGGRSGGGGDEETRTPDPLLAKEMLCQLSYVPRDPGQGEWWAFLDSNQRPLPYQGSALTS